MSAAGTPLSQVRSVLCAAPGYLEQHGAPAAPEDLKRHVLVASSGISPNPEWRFAQGARAIGVKVDPRLSVTTNDAAIEAALQGFGIARLLSYQVAPMLASGALRTVLGGYETGALPIHMIHREGRHAAAKVRSFVDMAVESLRNDPALR